MTTEQPATSLPEPHKGPPLWLLAILYTVFFNAGLYSVTMLAGGQSWPGPWEPQKVIVSYFQLHRAPVIWCVFLQFGATVCLGLFCVCTVSRLHFLGIRAAGVWIALLGSLLTVANGMGAGLAAWTMIRPEVVQHSDILVGLFFLSYALGGPGFSVPIGLFMAGVSVTAGIARLVPRWLALVGLILAVAGELSWLHLIRPEMFFLFLIPFVRFPGFIWLILIGFLLPGRRQTRAVVN